MCLYMCLTVCVCVRVHGGQGRGSVSLITDGSHPLCNLATSTRPPALLCVHLVLPGPPRLAQQRGGTNTHTHTHTHTHPHTGTHTATHTRTHTGTHTQCIYTQIRR